MKEYRIMTIYSPELEKDVRVFIYLPRSYTKSERNYPVLYMTDGQNLFDDQLASFGRSWRIMDLYGEYPDIPEAIIVGIESTGDDRDDELIPYRTYVEYKQQEVGGKADGFLTFITTTLKPYIDSRFRTYKNNKNTAIMGSSLGGVIIIYAALAYPEYFTRFGCVSNALIYEFYEPLKEAVIVADLSHVKKFYMDAGTKETDNISMQKGYVRRNEELYKIISDKLESSQCRLVIAEGAIHNERAWEKRFPAIMKFLFND